MIEWIVGGLLLYGFTRKKKKSATPTAATAAAMGGPGGALSPLNPAIVANIMQITTEEYYYDARMKLSVPQM